MLSSVASVLTDYSNSRAYYNLRKRYGHEEAKKILEVWVLANIDLPESAEEAIDYYVGVLE